MGQPENKRNQSSVCGRKEGQRKRNGKARGYADALREDIVG